MMDDPNPVLVAAAAVDAAERDEAAANDDAASTGASRDVPEKTAVQSVSELVEFYRGSIEHHQQHVLVVRRKRDERIRDLDDAIFTAEREFIATRSRIEREKAEAIAEARREIEAHDQLRRASQASLVVLGAAKDD